MRDQGYFVLVDTKKLEKTKDEDDMQLNIHNSKIYMYIVMPRYGMNLSQLFKEQSYLFSPNSIYALGIQLLNILEQIHAAGLIFNDLKLDNLCML